MCCRHLVFQDGRLIIYFDNFQRTVLARTIELKPLLLFLCTIKNMQKTLRLIPWRASWILVP